MQCPKPLVVRDEPFLRWLRNEHCVSCGDIPCDPHHLGDGIGSRRARDDKAVALCRKCHSKLHNNPTLEEDWELRAKQQRQRQRFLLDKQMWNWWQLPENYEDT